MAPDPHANTEQGYHKFRGGTGSFEVFWALGDDHREGEAPLEPGWYWWPCFPECLPDGEPNGPFNTSTEATDDALGGEE